MSKKCERKHLIVGPSLGDGMNIATMVHEDGLCEPMITVPRESGEGEEMRVEVCQDSPPGFFHVISSTSDRRGPPKVSIRPIEKTSIPS